jgi:ABC-type Fe3+/spermidine/putrescine transport system ATPase subunit/ubiquinone/menaquinone biosynthesis C-methylase UbiE
LLKLITGIERPDSGDIQFDGLSILKIEPNKRGAVLMFQKSYLFPFLNVEDNIGFGLKVQGASPETIRSEVKRMLNLIGLPGIEKRKVGQLSGGEGQRVALARALVTNPKLFLLDEPLSSLDTSVRQNLQEAIRNIQRELGITTIFVTHDLSEAMAMSDRMAILLNGRVAAYDKPDVLFHHPPCVESAKFVGVDLFLEGESSNGWLEAEDVGRVRIKDESKVGRSVFAIRPEHIRIQKEKKENLLSAVVLSCLYRGEVLEYQLQIGDVTTHARLPMPAPMKERGLSHEEVKIFYDQLGARQDLQGYYEDVALDDLLKHTRFDSATAVVEFGCGTGGFAEQLLAKHLSAHATYWGCDVSETMFKLTSDRLAQFGNRATLWHSTGAMTLPLPDESADRFVSNYVLDILSAQEIESVLGEAKRVLKTNGLLCLTGLTHGKGLFSKIWTAFWNLRFDLNPKWVGGCRPVTLTEFLSEWEMLHHNVIVARGISSEVIVAKQRSVAEI